MRTVEHECPSVSLVSWAQTARPVRLDSLTNEDRPSVVERALAQFDATDDVLFGFSTVALLVTPVVLLVVVVFG